MHDLLASLLNRMDARELIHHTKVLADRLTEQIAELDPEDEEDQKVGTIPFEIEELVSSMSDEGELSQRWVDQDPGGGAVRCPSTAVFVIDKRTSTPVSHRDIGIGVQPGAAWFCVSVYASKNKHLLAIEQPEIPRTSTLRFRRS